jgi:hypothetical protein
MIEFETTVNNKFTGRFEFGSLFHTTSDKVAAAHVLVPIGHWAVVRTERAEGRRLMTRLTTRLLPPF